jgi:hypothetical protein
VGWRAFVNWPQTGRSREPVPMTDGRGDLVANDLIDGQEVEIVAWRPHSPQGLAYHIRRVSDGREWWVRALYLRRGRETAQAVAE